MRSAAQVEDSARELWQALGMRRLAVAFGCMVALAMGSSACSIKVVGAVAPPTAVENQLLGAYEALDRQLVHQASFRGKAFGEKPSYPELEAQALQARSLQRYNADDLRRLKKRGCVGESLKARLVALSCPKSEDPAFPRRLKRIVAEENQARQQILRWAAHERAREAGQLLVDPKDEAALREAYVALLKAASEPGDLFENADGRYLPVQREGTQKPPASQGERQS